MARGPFDPTFGDLPEIIPVFPLAGALLLPRGSLPLNIFEPRYLNMISDAIKTEHRLIGMIQPTGNDDADAANAPGKTGPELYEIGCAGRIVSFSETRDGRYGITLAGIIRFRIREEAEMHDGYRRVRPDYGPFRDDMNDEYPRGEVDRDRLFEALGHYFKIHNIDPNWKAIKGMGDRMLVTSLAMGCPFNPSEKQALLEAASLAARGEILTTLLEMSTPSPEGGGENRLRH